MKAFVDDQGWSGAEIYFSESREKAVKYFQDKAIAAAEHRIKQHDVKHSGPMPSYFYGNLELAIRSNFGDGIQEYECTE